MKTLIVALLVSFTTLFSSLSIAHPTKTMDEKNSKLIKMVNKADKNDWRTLNTAARLSINWNADLELAKQWIDASLKINEHPETYEILGDYYLRKGDVKSAYEYYHTAFEKGMFTLDKKDSDRIQRKVLSFGRKL